MSNLQQIATELGLSGMALTMARCTVVSAQQWSQGDLGAGAVELWAGELEQRRRGAIEGASDMVRESAAEILAACRKGKDYPRTLTAEKLAQALLSVTE